MNRGTGGWVLRLTCIGCPAADEFRGVLLTFAGKRASEAGWHVPPDASGLIRPVSERAELCPKCVDALAG